MTVTEKILQELKGLKPSEQKEVLAYLRSLRRQKNTQSQQKPKPEKNKLISLIEEIAVDTGQPDLSTQHDHYLYGTPKK